MKILYISGFRDEYNDNIFIQKRKKAVISHLDNTNYSIDFIYNSSTSHPLILSNSRTFYSKLLPCNIDNGFMEKTHRRLFKFSKVYSTLTLKILQKQFRLKIDSYDIIIAETWENLCAILPFVTTKKVIGRIYGTGKLTENIEKNSFWKLNPFFHRTKQVINSDKVAGIIFNSTGSRSKDFFNILSDNNKKSMPIPVYLEMPNFLFGGGNPKKRIIEGKLSLLQVGRITDDHGFDDTVEIVHLLINNYNIPLIVNLVGNGPSYNKIYELIKQKKLTEHIKMPGRLGLDELKEFYSKADVVINYYGFNPIVEALNYKAFVITREFGEIGKILHKFFNKKIYRVCLPNCKVLKIESAFKKQYIDEVVKSVVWYFDNVSQLKDSDFIPTKPITVNDFSQNVFDYYQSFFKMIQYSKK